MGAGVTPDMVAMFGTAPMATDPASEANVLYPLDNVFMPANVAAPDIQWERGDAGDVFRVRIRNPTRRSPRTCSTAAAASRSTGTVDPDSWRAVLESDPERSGHAHRRSPAGRHEPCRARIDAAPAVRARQHLRRRLLLGPLRGRMQRIDAVSCVVRRTSSRTRRRTPPTPPTAASRATRSRRTAATSSAELLGRADRSTVFDLTADLSVDPAPTVFPTNVVSYLFSSFSPDATRLVTNLGNASA